MRDFPAFRILDAPPHPKVKAHVYPLMNFSVVADDHLLGVTHVIRGKDHIANTRRQRYIYDHFGWKVPVYRHYGRMGIEGVVLSTSQMRLGINDGTYTGWDDIRLGTLRALARRGISPEAVKNAMLAIGIGDTDISFSWDNLYAENKKIVDPMANRYFFVPDPVTAQIEGAQPHTAHAMLHPSDAARGTRTLEFTGRSSSRRARSSPEANDAPAQGSLQCEDHLERQHTLVLLCRGFACGCPGGKSTYRPVAAGAGNRSVHAPDTGWRDDRGLRTGRYGRRSGRLSSSSG